MKNEEVIRQLESLKSYAQDMEDKLDPQDMWRLDIIALSIAINIIKKQPSETSLQA